MAEVDQAFLEKLKDDLMAARKRIKLSAGSKPAEIAAFAALARAIVEVVRKMQEEE